MAGIVRKNLLVKIGLFFSFILIFFLMPRHAYASIDRNYLYKLMPSFEEDRMIKGATEAVFIIYVNSWLVGEEKEMLDVSWIQTPDSAKELYKITDDIFIVSFENSKKNKTLYVLIVTDEEYVITNFSGRFEWKDVIIEPIPELNEESIHKN